MKRNYKFVKGDDGEPSRKRRSSSRSVVPRQFRPQARRPDIQFLNPTISRPYGSTLELKSFDQIIAGGTVPFVSTASQTAVGTEPGVAWTGYTCINEMQTGTAFYQIVGTRATVTSITFDAQVVLSTGLAAATAVVGLYAATVRVALVYDRQPNGVYPALVDIFAINQSPPDFDSSVNIMNRSRFMVLADQYYDLDVAQAVVRDVHIYRKCRLDCEYGPTSPTIGELKTGAIYVVVIAANQSVNVPSINLTNAVSRVRYMD